MLFQITNHMLEKYHVYNKEITCPGQNLGDRGVSPSHSLRQRLDPSRENLGPNFLDLYKRSEVIQSQHSASQMCMSVDDHG